MDMQALIDGLSAQWQKERSETQMTLGNMIDFLESLPADTEIEGLSRPHSYRGYYSDLAFEPINDRVKAGELLNVCKSVMGRVLEGYKGGEYLMGEYAPVWIANYGCTGKRLIEIHADGSITAEYEDD